MPGPAAESRRRVLVLRSSRAPQFQRALTIARHRYPDAAISALSASALVEATRAEGVEHVIGHGASRLGIWRVGPAVRQQLRHAFDAVVVPLMYPDDRAASNLYRLAWWIGAPEVIIAADGEPPRAFSRSHMAGLAWRSTFPGAPDGAVTLMLLARAWLHRVLGRRRTPTGVRPRVLHVIDNLGMGGAQVQLAELLNRTPPECCDVEVLALSASSTFSEHRMSRRVPIAWLDDRLRPPQRIAAIRERCVAGRYDVVHTWLFGSNIVGVAGAALAGTPRIVTSVRSLSPRHYPDQLRWWHRPADALASRIADVVTVNATALVDDHARWTGLTRRRIRVVHNGVDPAPLESVTAGAREWLRQTLHLAADAVLIGTVGRLADEKDQATFLRAVAALVAGGTEICAVIVGEGPLQPALARLGSELGLEGPRLHWLGARTDARRVIAGLDVFVLTSRIEGFPNALLEAAMLGVPCVASDVGGVGDVIGDTADLFPPGDAAAAAGTVVRTLNSRRARDKAAVVRERCYRLFTAERLLERWSDVYGWGRAAA